MEENFKDKTPQELFNGSDLGKFFKFPDTDEDVDFILSNINTYHTLIIKELMKRSENRNAADALKKEGVVRLVDKVESDKDGNVPVTIELSNGGMSISDEYGRTTVGEALSKNEQFREYLRDKVAIHGQVVVHNKLFLSYYILASYQLKNSLFVSANTIFEPVHEIMESLFDNQKDAGFYGINEKGMRNIFEFMKDFDYSYVNKNLFNRVDVSSLNMTDSVRLKAVLYKDMPLFRNSIDPDIGYGFEYRHWDVMSKRIFLKWKWFSFLSRMSIEERSHTLIDNVRFKSLKPYIDMGFTNFCGAFSTEDIQSEYGEEIQSRKDFKSFKYIVVDPMSGLSKYDTRDVNDMDVYSFGDRYGLEHYDKVICLTWGILEPGGKVMVKIKEGYALPMTPHKLFYFISPLSSSIGKYGFRIHDNKMQNKNVGEGKMCTPYIFSLVMNLVRDYVVINKDIIYNEKGVLSVDFCKRFKSDYMMFSEKPLSDTYVEMIGVAFICLTRCFNGDHRDEGFFLEVEAGDNSNVQGSRSLIRVIDQKVVGRNPRFDSDYRYIKNAGITHKVKIAEFNMNKPSTVSNAQHLRSSHVSSGENNVKIYIPEVLLKDYETTHLNVAHNSQY